MNGYKATCADAVRENWTMGMADGCRLYGEIGEREYIRFHFLWLWSAPRWGGKEAVAQDKYAEKHGIDHYRARMAQVNRIAANMCEKAVR